MANNKDNTSTEGSFSAGPTISPPGNESSQLIRLAHVEGRMKIYGVTENELRTISTINLAVVVFSSLGTGCIAFSIDLHKDIIMAGSVLAPNVKEIADIWRPLGFISGIVCYLIAATAWLVRGGFIKTIKNEADNS